MKFSTKVFAEPLLEFGEQHTAIDPRLGLVEAGPLQVHLGDNVKFGLIGTAECIEHTKSYFDRASRGIDSSAEKHPNMNPSFPGLENQNPFRTRFSISEICSEALSKASVERICKEPNDEKAATLAVDEICRILEDFYGRGERPDSVLIVLSVRLIARLFNLQSEYVASPSGDPELQASANFRGMLKARAMRFPFSTQIIWEDVVNPSAKIPQKVKAQTDRKIQDEAGRSWNLFASLYYKGTGKIPWRRLPDEAELRSCYVGISFYQDRQKSSVWTSAAQMFDERGRGFILRGAKARSEARNRHPYLEEQDAYDLTKRVLDSYKQHHKHFPARAVFFKTSRFRDEEAEGINRALREVETELKDLVWIQEGHDIRVFRDGDYPVLRGTFVDLGDKGVLYTIGSIPYYGTYPGMYVPNPLMIVPHECSDRTLAEIAEDVFSLTKVNWNSTQVNQKLPIPIRAARKVGDVLKYIDEETQVSSDYSRYM